MEVHKGMKERKGRRAYNVHHQASMTAQCYHTTSSTYVDESTNESESSLLEGSNTFPRVWIVIMCVLSPLPLPSPGVGEV